MAAIGSSSTSSRTSKTSSTSDGPGAGGEQRGPIGAAIGIVRIVHAFPAGLDALVTVAFALVAGAEPRVAVTLGVAMFALQAAIGTANDLIDEPRDRGTKLGKPLPRGLISRRAGVAVLAIAIGVGVG